MRKLILSFFILITFSVFAQKIEQKMYYKTEGNEKIITQNEFDETMAKIRAKMEAIAKHVKLNTDIIDIKITEDSIINTFKLNIKLSDIDEEEGEASGKEKIYSYLNKKLPSHLLKTINNEELYLDNFLGKPLVLNFWFTTCKPCIDEMPILNTIKEKYADKVNFISITFNTKEEVEEFFKTHRFDYTKVVGAKAFTDEIGISAFPKNIFIDKNGIVKRIESGIPYISNTNNKLKLGNGEEFEAYLKELF